MTINVALVTAEALVFGCDSVASTTKHLLDPFQYKTTKLIGGKYTLEFSYDELVPYVTGAWGGVKKMFPLQLPRKGEAGACVAAITAGLARLNDRTMNSLAAEFMSKQNKRSKLLVNVEAIANEFLRFIRKEYNRHHSGSKIPKKFWDGPGFLVGGYGRDDQLPSLYRVQCRERFC